MRDEKMLSQSACTYVTGLKDPLNFTLEDVKVWDWAWGLNHQGRWSGATPVMWSVLSHTGLVYELGMRETAGKLSVIDQMGLLLHDAAEGYIVDMPRPIKHTVVGEAFQRAETTIAEVLFRRFGIEQDMLNWELIKRYDNQALWIEWEHFFQEERKAYPNLHTCVYTMDPMSVELKAAKPLDYVNHLRHLALVLREHVQIPNFNELFECPERLRPYAMPAVEQKGPEIVIDSPPRDLSILNRRID